MKPGRLYPFVLTLLLILTLTDLERAEAFWGFGDGRATGKNGLDLDRGYDVNTVVTMTGRAVVTPHPGEGNNVVIEITNNNEAVTLCVGPGAYWDKHGIQINRNDEISAKGSKAQGKDGKTYLLAQKITNQTTGVQAVLRDEKGDPAWKGANTNSMRTERSPARSGGMGGRMMRGGGGMMRR